MDSEKHSESAGHTARVPSPSSRDTRGSLALQALALIGIAFGYKGLFTAPPGPEIDAQKQVEYWLFSPTENAPLVVLALVAWLVYRRWPRVQALERATGPWWLIAPSLALGLAFYLWATYTSTVHLQAFSLAFNAVGLTALFWGFPGLRALWLPIAFVLFCVPIPAPLFLALVWKLQLITAEYAGGLLYLLREPALVSGDQILRAKQGFQVIEGCSGLRSAETLTMLTVILIDLFGRQGLHALLLFVCAPLVAFALNGLRVLTLILNPHSEILGVHTLQGVVILLVGLLVVYALDGLLERVLAPLGRRRGDPSSLAGLTRPLVRWIPAGGLLLVALATTAVSHWGPVWQLADQGPRLLRAQVTGALDAWESTQSETDWMFVGSASFGEVVHRSYEVQGESVEVFIGTANLGPGGGSPLSPVVELPGSGWAIREASPERLQPDGRDVQARVLKKGGRRMLVYHWNAGALSLARETFRSLLGLDRSPYRRQVPLYTARISTPLVDRPPDTPDRARSRAEERLSGVYERLEPVLREIESTGPRG